MMMMLNGDGDADAPFLTGHQVLCYILLWNSLVCLPLKSQALLSSCVSILYLSVPITCLPELQLKLPDSSHPRRPHGDVIDFLFGGLPSLLPFLTFIYFISQLLLFLLHTQTSQHRLR
jgi:hypothetical protein